MRWTTPRVACANASANCPPQARALDLGCAVGRSSFELARRCSEVIGIDYSQSFISAATKLRDAGELAYARTDEGPRTTPLVARVPAEIDRARVTFEHGDAQSLREGARRVRRGPDGEPN